MKVTHKLGGFDEMGALLKELPVTVEKRILQDATMATLTAVLPEIKAAAPVHQGARSAASKMYGTLKSNIHVARLRIVKKGQKGARVSTGKSFWGYFYEIGTRYQPARAWFAPKFTALQSRMESLLGAAIGKGIESEAAKYKGGRNK